MNTLDNLLLIDVYQCTHASTNKISVSETYQNQTGILSYVRPRERLRTKLQND